MQDTNPFSGERNNRHEADLNKLEAHARRGHMGAYSAQMVELIAMIRKQEAALAKVAPAVATVDTPEFYGRLTCCIIAPGDKTESEIAGLIAHIDAHVSTQVAAAVAAKDAEILALHRKLAGEALRADQGWSRYEQANKSHIAATMTLSTKDAEIARLTTSKLEHELEFLEEWLFTAYDPVGNQCCGNGNGGECCGNPDPVFLSQQEYLAAMQERLKSVNFLLLITPPAPVDSEVSHD